MSKRCGNRGADAPSTTPHGTARVIRPPLVEFLEAGIGIGLEDTAAAAQVLSGMFALAVGRAVVDRARRGLDYPRPLIADIGQDPALLDPSAQSFVSSRAIKRADRDVVCMKQIAGHDLGFDLLAPWRQRLYRPAGPVDQGRVRTVCAHGDEDFVLSV